MQEMETAQEVLAFWFDECGPDKWFAKDAAFDHAIAARFAPLIHEALAGAIDGWSWEARGRLAAILVLDQFTRNVFRDTPRAFAGDDKALALARGAEAAGHLGALTLDERKFMLMPLMHCEDLGAQTDALRLFEAHCDADTLDYAAQHQRIIARFGRFPHRNAILGRASTPEELAFLQEPGSSF